MDDEQFNRQLALVFSNGRGEVGLEIGTDPGLPTAEHIRIPACLKKRWVAKREAVAGAPAATDPEVSTGSIYVHNGDLFEQKADGTIGARLYDFSIPAPTIGDIRKFVAANTAHVRDTELSEQQIRWVHAVRFWAVVAGFVATSKSKEYVDVADPADTEISDLVKDTAAFIANYSGNAWTASAARATSWRKSNHATGGDRATGFPRRWLQKEQYWPTEKDRNKQAAAEKTVTSAFYVATHATSQHAVLALMAPTDQDHWALLNPQYGLIPRWEVMESIKIRMVPKTQVAGVSMVTDACVCMRMLIKEGLAPLLEGADQSPALAAAFTEVEKKGMQVASYAGWFFDGHPKGTKPSAFNQKDGAYAELVGELGSVATQYYKGSTIGDSPSLDNAARQMAPETARQSWGALARAKKSMSPQDVFRVYGRIKGASTAMSANRILSTDEAERTSAIGVYNTALSTIATAFGVSHPPTISKDLIDANAEAADAQAKALDSVLRAAGTSA